MDIHLLEATPRLLNGMSEIASEKALEYLEKMGVTVHLKLRREILRWYESYFDRARN